MYSLIGTARRNGIDPEANLRYALTHITDHPVSCFDGLLPWDVAAPLDTAAWRASK
jgi:hypothetical protein